MAGNADGIIVITGVNRTAADVGAGCGVPFPVCGMSGQGCKVTGNCIQFELSRQTFKVKAAC